MREIMETIVKKIVLEIGGVELSLTVEDARKLAASLNELLKSDGQPVYVPTPYPIFQPRWIGPYITWSGTAASQAILTNTTGERFAYTLNEPQSGFAHDA